ncbi:unnamed protein product [Penicillium nalgiovense]|nr:unnamed protein product [Penicillium nalgiovense]
MRVKVYITDFESYYTREIFQMSCQREGKVNGLLNERFLSYEPILRSVAPTPPLYLYLLSVILHHLPSFNSPASCLFLSSISAMASIGWFPRAKSGPGSIVPFEKPTISAWSIRQKQSQHNYQREEWDLEFGPSTAEATFHVQQDYGPRAYMRVYMQVPHPSTEFEPREVRRRQAALCPHREVNALKCFHQEHATMTPALLGVREELQGDDDVVPGGYIVYMVFQHVPGFRLADDQGAPVPGYPLHTFFRKFEL